MCARRPWSSSFVSAGIAALQGDLPCMIVPAVTWLQITASARPARRKRAPRRCHAEPKRPCLALLTRCARASRRLSSRHPVVPAQGPRNVDPPVWTGGRRDRGEHRGWALNRWRSTRKRSRDPYFVAASSSAACLVWMWPPARALAAKWRGSLAAILGREREGKCGSGCPLPSCWWCCKGSRRRSLAPPPRPSRVGRARPRWASRRRSSSGAFGRGHRGSTSPVSQITGIALGLLVVKLGQRLPRALESMVAACPHQAWSARWANDFFVLAAICPAAAPTLVPGRLRRVGVGSPARGPRGCRQSCRGTAGARSPRPRASRQHRGRRPRLLSSAPSDRVRLLAGPATITPPRCRGAGRRCEVPIASVLPASCGDQVAIAGVRCASSPSPSRPQRVATPRCGCCGRRDVRRAIRALPHCTRRSTRVDRQRRLNPIPLPSRGARSVVCSPTRARRALYR